MPCFWGLLESITVTLKAFTIPTRMMEKHLHVWTNMVLYLYMMSAQAILGYNTSLKLFNLALQSSLFIVCSCKISNYIRENELSPCQGRSMARIFIHDMSVVVVTSYVSELSPFTFILVQDVNLFMHRIASLEFK